MKILILVTILFLTNFIFLEKFLACAGDEVNNGGGVSEGNIATAYIGLNRYIDLCLHLPSCQLNEKERYTITQIKKSLPIEYQAKNQLQFVSESKNPGTFIIDGKMKIAKTGDEVGSPIVVNTDLLYYKNLRTGLTEGIRLGNAVQILIHELGHHHGIKDHTFLDLLGAKVSMNLSQNAISARLLAESCRVKAVVINGKNEDEFPQVLMYVFDQIIDVTEKFKKTLECQSLGLPIPANIPRDLVISFSKPSGAMYHNIYWHKHKIKSNRGVLVLKGHLTKTCGKAPNIIFNNKKYEALIKLKIKKKKNHLGKEIWAYKEGSLEVREEYDPWWKILRIPFLDELSVEDNEEPSSFLP